MRDSEIINALFERDESVLGVISERFGKLCLKIALNILQNAEEAEECVNDAYLNIWESIPPARPDNLRAFICRITRNPAVNRVKFNAAKKRSSGSVISLTELEGMIGESGETGDPADYNALGELIDKFLRSEKPEAQLIFMRRYFFLDSVTEISKMYGYSESKVKSVLFRTRKRLEKFLIKEGFDI